MDGYAIWAKTDEDEGEMEVNIVKSQN